MPLPSPIFPDTLLATGASAAVAILGWAAGILTPGGGLAAVLVGTAILLGTGVPGAAVLLTFFIGSSVISKLSPDPAAQRQEAKGARRDQWQVLANGGPAALGALLPGAGLWIVTASLAAAAADTWATSAGAWSRKPPRHLLSGLMVPHGTSGGITLLGTAGAVVASVTVAIVGAVGAHAPLLFPSASLTGMLAMLADSYLGARWQGRFHCGRCDQATERRVHRCGTKTVPVGGQAWLTNDGVNAAASTLGGLLGYAAWLWSASG